MAGQIWRVYLGISALVMLTQNIVNGNRCSDNVFMAQHPTDIIFDSTNNKYYLAGSNFIYKLNNSFCKEYGINASLDSNNINHILVKHDDSLIFCGTGGGGICKKVAVSNFNATKNPSKVSIVPQYKSSSTVAFVGKIANESVLIVALSAPKSEFSNYSLISVRDIDTFGILCKNFVEMHFEFKTDDDKNNYLENYIPKTGFSSHESAFIVTYQRFDNISNKMTPKVARITKCNNGDYVFTDTVIECDNSTSLKHAAILREDGSSHATYLAAIFDNDICIYRMSDLIEHFDNITNTIKNQQDIVLGPLNKPLRPTKRIPLPNLSKITSFTATVFNNGRHVLFYIGTDRREIYRGFNSENVNEFNGILIPFKTEKEIHRLKFVHDGIVAFTNNSVKYESESQCTNKTWDTCLKNTLGLGLCGWCIKVQKCTTLAACGENRYWLPSIQTKPNVFLNVSPIQMGKEKEFRIHFNLTALLNYGNFTCFYSRINGIHGIKDIDFDVTDVSSEPKCKVPAQTGNHYLNQTVLLRWGQNKSNVAEQVICYYNCTSINALYRCVQGNCRPTNCKWCVCNELCINSDEECPGPDSNAPGKQVISSNLPRAVSKAEIHVGLNKSISIYGIHFINPNSCDDNQIKPRCSINGAILGADYINHTTIQCSPYKLESNTTIELHYGNLTTIRETIQVGTYNCTDIGMDCSTCLDNYMKYGCLWCEAQHQCEHKELSNCSMAPQCPKPKIYGVSQNATLIHGGELITIHGKGLERFDEDTDIVQLAGVNCTVIQHLSNSDRISCKAGIVNEARYGNVTVRIRNHTSTLLKQVFSYKDPKDSEILFNKGPVAGGTKLNITGADFDVCSKDDLNITIGNKFVCATDTLTSTWIGCTTSPGEIANNLSIHLTFRNSNTIKLNSTFCYVADPTLSYITPNKTISSGGIDITVVGNGFNAIQQPEIGIVGSSDFVPCSGLRNDSMILCPSPSNTVPISRSKRDLTTQKGIVFKMDGIKLKSEIAYTPDPVILEFEEEKNIRSFSKESGYIIIKGSRLNDAVQAKDYTVSVGKSECDVVHRLTSTELKCYPPIKEPNKQNETSPAPEVQVKIGNLVFEVGYLKYIYVKPETDDPTLYIIIGILVAVVVGVVIGSVVIFKYVSRRNKQKCQDVIEKTEMEVIEQCREAFADLQTDMTDITAELVELGIPFNNLFTYVFQFVFPQCSGENIKSHTALNDLQDHEGTKEDMAASMTKLDQLISNKFFVVSFIRTMDNQRKFKLQDRSDVAGYLTLLLIDKMDYFTEIVELLLPKLIRERVSRKQQKYIFRRLETITEKLVVNWLAVCMYGPLKKCSGSTLFMLYKAIEILSQKSAIDAVTQQTRATLCQHNLLVIDFEPEVLNLTVLINNGKFETTCRVLDCDTITQVKNKCINACYKIESTSTKPRVEEIDLEWRISDSARKLLYDEDQSSVITSNCHRKLNTMEHYGVSSGSTVCLLSKDLVTADSEYENLQSMNERKNLVPTEDPGPTRLLELLTFHLVGNEEKWATKKALAELNLNRLLQTKFNLKKYIDDVIEHILNLDDVPIPVRHLFSILEKAGAQENQDSTTIGSWKIQSYAIRFWTRLLSQPELLFDLNKESEKYVQPNLNVIQLAYIDSFSPPQRLDKNSPSHKLLFYKDCADYRESIQSFLKSKRNCEPVSNTELSAELTKLPTVAASIPINRQSVLYQIYSVIDSYMGQIVTDLDKRKESSRLELSEKLHKVFETMRNS
ncbi:plexin-A4 isoform X2 [Patella vulgata]|uniref:plexin-A4 isoform X2 n=1 Tax=Patella vulgata TaxID=6465 RepID=UPI00217FD509|nr:plexin-A4 isoform X2 [Patella vulgata]